VKKFAVGIMEKAGSFGYTREYLNGLEAQIRAEISKLQGNRLLEDIMNGLSVAYKD
jgi:geranylgeranyl diphosphate synthase type 3